MAETLKAELDSVDANVHQAPININLTETIPLDLPDLNFTGYDVSPSKMKLNNTGYTVTVSGKFSPDNAPIISGGPLESTYKFSQFHFHWGPDDQEGSEHTFDGRSTALELHVVHVNQKYESQEEALLKKDGVVIVAYLIIVGAKHEGLNAVVRGLPEVENPHTSLKIQPQPLQNLCPRFTKDYFLYWGSVISPSCSHLIQWLVCRTPLEASAEQIAAFRGLQNVNAEPLLRNYRDPQELASRKVFHCSPGERAGFGLHCDPKRTVQVTGRPTTSTGDVLSVEEPCTSLEEAESRGKMSATQGSMRASPTRSGADVPDMERTDDGDLSKPILDDTQEGPPSAMPPEGASFTGTATSGGRGGGGGGGGSAVGSAGRPASAGRPSQPTSQYQSGVQKTGSRGASLASRAVSFSNLGPLKTRSGCLAFDIPLGDAWPDAEYTGAAMESPIFIQASDAVRMAFPPLKFDGHFDKGVGLLLTNSGETVEISLMKSTTRPVLSGGPLQGRYILDSAHFHWLANDDAEGGTHAMNNARCEIECHMVHIHENYKSKTEAMEHPNGLAVCSVLHQVGGEECGAFERICAELSRINELYTQAELPGMDLSYMTSVVKPHNYFIYPGRFFGREDGKALVWIVFAEPIGICCQNVAALQRLQLSKDFRVHSTHPLGDRPLIAVVSEDDAKRSDGAAAAGEGTEADYTVGALRTTPSGRIAGLGGDEWPNTPFQSAAGILMSPLDLVTSTIPSIPMTPLQYRGHFEVGDVRIEMRNTGEAIDIKWRGVSPMPTLAGGPLTEEYEFDSAHFHWAANPEDVGAMHRINSKRCDLEVHLVHYKKSLGTRQEAMFEPDGLAVCSFLIQVGGSENSAFSRLTDNMPRVKEVDSVTELTGNLSWLQHRAGPHGFFTYPGTLFGADQGINVVWIVYPTPVLICCQHVATFYKVDVLDFERVHPLHEPTGRPMYYSINPDSCAAPAS